MCSRNVFLILQCLGLWGLIWTDSYSWGFLSLHRLWTAACGSTRPSSHSLVRSTSGWEEQNSSNPLGVMELQWEQDTAEPGGPRSAENQLMDCTGQMWSSLNVPDEKWGFFITQTEDDPGWGRADDMGSSFAQLGCSSSQSVPGPGEHHWGGCALITQIFHSICRWALSTDNGTSIRNFYHLELKSPRRLCKYKLCSSKDVAYYWLNPSGWAANKQSCSSTVPSLQFSSPSSSVFLSHAGSFVEWLFWSGWKLGLVQGLGFFSWADFQTWSLTWPDILSRCKGTELTQGMEFKTHEKRTRLCKQGQGADKISWLQPGTAAFSMQCLTVCPCADGAAAAEPHDSAREDFLLENHLAGKPEPGLCSFSGEM